MASSNTCSSSAHIVGVAASTSSSLLHEVRVVLEDVPFNSMFAWGVVDGLVDGEIWCDRERQPTFAHVMHPYGMSLLLALSSHLDFDALKQHIDWCRQTTCGLWMQVHPQRLAADLDGVLDADVVPLQSVPSGVCVQRFTRCNFLFIPAQYAAIAPMRPLPHKVKVRPMTSEDFALLGFGVSPRHFWRNAHDFLAHGGGWCITDDEEVISIAFSSFRLDSRLEIGVETHPQYRGRGLAKYAASAIIDQCVASGIEPVWSCRKQNVLSFHLAQTLGFSPTLEGAYYHLPKASSGS